MREIKDVLSMESPKGYKANAGFIEGLIGAIIAVVIAVYMVVYVAIPAVNDAAANGNLSDMQKAMMTIVGIVVILIPLGIAMGVVRL